MRAYFARQGFFALRAVSLRFENEEVTDIDVWLYGRQSATVRMRGLVDVKDKRSPKAFERVLWARGMQLALGCDRAIVATTENNPKVAQFAQQQQAALLTKSFLERLERGLQLDDRLTAEEFFENIQSYKTHKQDGEWLAVLEVAKSSVVSSEGFPAFNKCMTGFQFFAGRIDTRVQNREQVLRCVLETAALACIALDAALERVIFADQPERYDTIMAGVTFGDSGAGKTQKSIDTILSIISSGMENGRVMAMQVKEALDRMFGSVRAEIIAEHFSREHNAGVLFSVARELDDRAHGPMVTSLNTLSKEARSILGVFLDFCSVRRVSVLGTVSEQEPPKVTAEQKDSEAAEGKLL